jgi:hypothetical protein
MGRKDLIPAPQHIAVYIVGDAVFSTKHEGLIDNNGLISRGNCASVDRFGV